MKYLSFLIIVFFFAQPSNGQITTSKMTQVIYSIQNGYRPAPKIGFDCRFGSYFFPQIKKKPAIQTITQANGFWLQTNETAVIELNKKNTFSGCFVPAKPPFSQLDFTNPLRIPDYVSTLGVICKQELKLDKITPMPVRFRLGSLEYVNWLERKPNAKKPD